MATKEFYIELAALVAKRNHAALMIEKWQEKVQATENRINELTSEAQAQGYGAPEQVQVQA